MSWGRSVPFKANAERRHHIPKQRHRVTNSAAYDAALRQRGSLTIWFTDAAIAAWKAEPRTTRGGQPRYSALAITAALPLRAVFRRKLHIAVDADTGQIAAAALTTSDVDDASQIGALLSQVDGAVASFTADGAYDQDGVYGEVVARHPEASVIVPPRSNAVPSDTAETAPTMRDRHLKIIAERGRMAWQKAAGYNWRALVEADISRFKRVIGNGLRSRTDHRRATEVAIAVNALNRMLEFGRPEYVRLP